jgi:hypothetical protein
VTTIRDEPVQDPELADSVRALLEEAVLLCGDIDDELADVVLTAENALTDEEARRLFTRIIRMLREATGKPTTPDERARLSAEVRMLVEELVAHPRGRNAMAEPSPAPAVSRASRPSREHLELRVFAGLPVREVVPVPTFLGQQISVKEGHVRTQDLQLWEDNFRLDLHIQEFKQRYHRHPDQAELLAILLETLELPGTEGGRLPGAAGGKKDLFQIPRLAESIAVRGVEQPPVIDWWGVPWDGNRRIAACFYILNNPDSTEEAKRRASMVRVWQTPRDATPDQVRAIVVARNFDADYKVPWPEYVRARQIYDAYVERYDLASSRRPVTPAQDLKIRQGIATDFGIKTNHVTRYVKMVTWATEFEEYHREQGRDESRILHRANRLFQYFYELDSGRGEDKLAEKLHADPAFKALVFDLMFEGKFRNWSQVRDLKRVVTLPAAVDALKRAHADTYVASARQHVDDAIMEARKNSAALRAVGIGDQLQRVTKWLEEDATLAVLQSMDARLLRRFQVAFHALDGTITAATSQADAEAAVAPPGGSETGTRESE